MNRSEDGSGPVFDQGSPDLHEGRLDMKIKFVKPANITSG